MARPTKAQQQVRSSAEETPAGADVDEDTGATPAVASLALCGIDPLLTPTEVSAWIRKPVATLDQWRYRGQGPASIKCGNDVRYRRSDIEAWLSANTRGTGLAGAA